MRRLQSGSISRKYTDQYTTMLTVAFLLFTHVVVSADVDTDEIFRIPSEDAKANYKLHCSGQPLSQILQEISEKSGLSFEVIGDADVPVTMHVQGKSLTSVVSGLVAKLNFLAVRQHSGYVVYAGNAEDEIGDTPVTYIHRLTSTETSLAVAELSKAGFVDLSVSPLADQRALILRGPLARIKESISYLDIFDRATPRISIEVLVVEYMHGNRFQWRYDLTDGTHKSVSNVGFNPASMAANLAFAYQTVEALDGAFKANLSLLSAQNMVKVRTNPHVSVSNGKTGTVKLEQEMHIVLSNSSSSFGTTLSLEKIKAGVELTITPRIIGKNATLINLDVSAMVAVFAPGETATQYAIDRNTIVTNVDVGEGETLILGGLIKEEKRTGSSGVPVLSRIPLLGWLLKSRNEVGHYVESVVYITPYETTESSHKPSLMQSSSQSGLN